MGMVTVKIRCITDKKSIYFKKGEIYTAIRPKDDLKGLFWGIYIADDDDPGWYAFPSEYFEVVE